MMRKEIFLFFGALCWYATSSQAVSCTEDTQCNVGHYCEANTRICRTCLSCQDLKREPPTTTNACIKSVAECGDCLKGWEKDRLGDVNAACVLSVPEGTPHYVWWLIGVGILIFLALMVGIIVYVWMNPNIFENFKLRGNSSGGAVSTDIRAVTRATAPEAPPPYTPNCDIPYTSVRTTESPYPPTHDAIDIGDLNSEEEGPFLKCGQGARLHNTREPSANQAATVYNLPIYDREDQPPSPEPPIVTEVTDNSPLHDDETVASPWIPGAPSNGDINANVSEVSPNGEGATSVNLSAMLAAAKDTTIVEVPAPKRMRLRPTADNSRKADSTPSSDSSQGNFSGAQNSQPFNFITQITNVVQINQT